MLQIKKSKYSSSRLFFFYCILLLLFAIVNTSYGQILPADTTQEITAPQWPDDSLERRTPRSSIVNFIQAVSQENYTRAANYIDYTEPQTQQQKAALARSLQRLLDQHGHIMPYSWLSEDTLGDQDDELKPNLERVGTVTIGQETFDLLLEKEKGPDGGPIWLFSSEMMEKIPLLEDEEATVSYTERVLPDFLETKKWAGVPIGHWLIMLVLAVSVYLLAWGVTSLFLLLIRIFWRRSNEEHIEGIVKAFSLPIRLYMAVWLFVICSREIGISIIVRQQFSHITVIVGLIAFLLLLWQLIDFITRFSEKQMNRRGNLAGLSAVLFLRRGAKFAVIAFGFIVILDTFGFDVTTGIAALGIGGIALALGAQKTVENFVGSVTLIADQPVRVGDFCKVGDTVGTVEQIGMRSTRIRTLDRTIVTIPNGEFSSLKIENYAHRDRFWFHPILTLRYETTPDQIRFLLVELRSILINHPKVDPNPARVRLIELGSTSLNLEIFAYVHAKDFDEFLEIKEALILSIMDTVEASGTGFAFPSQTLYMATDKGLSQENAQKAEQIVQRWRQDGNEE